MFLGLFKKKIDPALGFIVKWSSSKQK